MSQFSVKSDISKLYMDIKSISKDVAKVSFAVDKVAGDLGYEIASTAAIRSRLRGISDDVGEYEKSMSGLSDGLKNAVERYKTAEQKVYENAGGKGSAISAAWSDAVMGGGGKKRKEGPYTWDDFWDMLGEASGGTGLIAGIGRVVTSDKSKGTTWTKLVNDMIKAGDKIKDAVETSGKKVNVKWKEMFGLDKWNPKGTWTKSFTKNLGEAAAEVSWLSWLTSGISSGIDNYEEHGGFTERMMEETLVETAIDVGKGIAVTAGVAAAFAAAGVTAPVAAVAVVGAGVAWGIDAASKAITGKKFNDLVGDAIIDTHHAVQDFKKKTVKAVKGKLKAAWKSVSSFAW